jgi:hypothetical protein
VRALPLPSVRPEHALQNWFCNTATTMEFIIVSSISKTSWKPYTLINQLLCLPKRHQQNVKLSQRYESFAYYLLKQYINIACEGEREIWD